MSNLSQFFGGSLWSQPTIWLQDKKVGGTGGGYMDSANTLYTRDINRINYNSLGASLVNDGTTSSTVGAVGTQTIVNNPSTGVHNTSSHVILTAGTYVYKLKVNYSSAATRQIHVIYDKTAGADLAQSVGVGSAIDSSHEPPFEGVFTLTATSNVDIRTSTSTVVTASTGNMGHAESTNSSVNIVHTDLILHKIA